MSLVGDPSARSGSEAAREFARLADELRAIFAGYGRDVSSDAGFNALALRGFSFQFRFCRAYGAFCRGRHRTPETVDHWSRIPPVPASAFKHLDLFAGDVGEPEATFRTSGTTRGAGTRGRHHVLDLELYRASALPPFGRHVVPEGERLPILSLVPDAASAPDSSLSRMLAMVTEEWGVEPSRSFIRADGELDLEAFGSTCREAQAGNKPVVVAGTAFSFVHLLDRLVETGTTIRLPPGSRVMETGGLKGRSRHVPRTELYSGIRSRLGVAEPFIVNEYGMTELLSQFYDGVAGGSARERSVHEGPPWLRTRVLDPTTLEPVEQGRPGLLCHHDLANLGSVSAVLTEDRGVAVDGGIHLLGRAEGAEPRGCSIAMDELLAVTGRGR